jgi:hypothetical protein
VALDHVGGVAGRRAALTRHNAATSIRLAETLVEFASRQPVDRFGGATFTLTGGGGGGSGATTTSTQRSACGQSGGGSQTEPSRPTATTPATASNTTAPSRSVTITCSSRRLIPVSVFVTSPKRIVIFPSNGAPFTPTPGSVYSRLVSMGRPFSVTLPGFPLLVKAGCRLGSQAPVACVERFEASTVSEPSALRIVAVFRSTEAFGVRVSIVCEPAPPSTATCPFAVKPATPSAGAPACGHGFPPTAAASAATRPLLAEQVQLASAFAVAGSTSRPSKTQKRASILRSIPFVGEG